MEDNKNLEQNSLDTSTEKENTKNFGPIFKRLAVHTFYQIKNAYNGTYNEKINITDINYRDGYFIFDHGENSVINFHIRELPGWLFGMWFFDGEDDPEEGNDKNKNYIKVYLFTQYEDEIDKFKPSRSCFCEETKIPYKRDKKNSINLIYDSYDQFFIEFKVNRMIHFIHKDPYLAFCRDNDEYDYKYEYLSRAEAKRIYLSYRKRKDAEIAKEKKNLESFLNFMTDEFLPTLGETIEGLDLKDKGENWFPRYDLVAPFEANKDKFNLERPGWYCIEPGNKEEKMLYTKLGKFNRCANLCHDSIYFKSSDKDNN